jgi:molecular chaperone DnaK (HSP70)
VIADVVLIALLALALVAGVSWPLIAGGHEVVEVAVDPARVALEDEITASLQAIKELQFDHQAGSLSDDDFQRMERAERANAARLIRRRSELDGDS